MVKACGFLVLPWGFPPWTVLQQSYACLFMIYSFSLSQSLCLLSFPVIVGLPCWGSWVTVVVTVWRTVDESWLSCNEDEGFLRVTLSERDLIGFQSPVIYGHRFAQMRVHLVQKWSANGHIIAPTLSPPPHAHIIWGSGACIYQQVSEVNMLTSLIMVAVLLNGLWVKQHEICRDV